MEMFIRIIEFKDKMLTELVEKSNHFLKSVKTSGIISVKAHQWFTYKCKKKKKKKILEKCICFPKLKRLLYVPGSPAISYYETPIAFRIFGSLS